LGVARHLAKRGVLEASTTSCSDAGGMGGGAGGSYAGRPSRRTAYGLQVLPCLIVIPSPEQPWLLQQQQHLPSLEVWYLS
jgi:hypothetical protein